MGNDSALRAITNRLNITPVQDLPRVAEFLAGQLANCPLEVLFADTKARDSSVTAHKLKTRISSLLQDRSAAGRYTAVVLIRTIIDHGGVDALRASESWARGLLNCLNKPDPVPLKTLYLVSLTRIFYLAQDDSTLLREIATPLLPSYIKTCLGLLRPIEVASSGTETKSVPSPLFDLVLKCWIQLLPRQASIFRPSLSQIRVFCLNLIGNSDTSVRIRDLATELLSLLLSSAPKNNFAQEWSQMTSSIIESAHITTSKIFRAVIEEHESNNPALQTISGKQNFSKEAKSTENDKIGLGTWNGIYEGSNRLIVLLSWLARLVSIPTSLSVAAPIGALLDLTARIMAVNVPDTKTDAGNAMRFHKEASREEKEELWLNLPRIHVSCLHLLHSMWCSYRQALLPVQRTIATQVFDLFDSMCWHNDVRHETYKLYTALLADTDISNLDLRQAAFSRLIEQCCNNLKEGFVGETAVAPGAGKSTHIDLKATTSQGTNGQIQHAHAHVGSRSDAFQAAWKLLPELLKECPTSMINRQLRTEMDRLAVLLDHDDAMLASVINPVITKEKSTASLLPFLATLKTDSTAVEALLRPRMPVIQEDYTTSLGKPSHDISIDAEEEEDVPHQDSDILSQLENSLDEQANSDNHEIDVNDLPRDMLSDENLQNAGAQKRPFDDLVSSAAVGEGTSITEEAGQRETKRPKPAADLSEVVMESEDSRDEGQTLKHPMDEKANATSAASDNRGSERKEPDYSVTLSTSRTVQAEESESSDSEIPTIDPGFDTDEEEDLE